MLGFAPIADLPLATIPAAASLATASLFSALLSNPHGERRFLIILEPYDAS